MLQNLFIATIFGIVEFLLGAIALMPYEGSMYVRLGILTIMMVVFILYIQIIKKYGSNVGSSITTCSIFLFALLFSGELIMIQLPLIFILCGILTLAIVIAKIPTKETSESTP